MLIRKNNKLGSLPLEDRKKLDDWLRSEPYRRVVELAAAPRPDGLALRTNKFLAPDPLEGLADLAVHNPEAANAAVTGLMTQQAVLALVQFDSHKFDFRKFSVLTRFKNGLDEKAYRERLIELKQ